MKSSGVALASLLAAVLLQAHPTPADACGVKLTIKTQGPRKAGQASKPTRTDQGRTVVAARVNRAPIAAGPARAEPRRPVNVSDPDAPRPDQTTGASKPVEKPAAVEKTATVQKPAVEKPAAVEKSAAVEKPAVVEKPVVEKPEKPAAVEKPAKVAVAVTFGEEVHFTLGGYNLGASAQAALTSDAKWLAANPSVRLSVEGHADPTGNADANMTLSQKRAEVVRDFLVAKGVDASRIDVAGFGDTQLKYDGADHRNRRVMLVRKD